MQLTYNGVELHQAEFVKRDRDLVYDPSGRDLMYVRHLIGVTAVISRGGWPVGTEATSISEAARRDVYNPAQVPSLPVTTPSTRTQVSQRKDFTGDRDTVGVMPILTDAEIRVRLYSPRKQLQITAWDNVGNAILWLNSPPFGTTTDVFGGPFPRAVDIIDSPGEPNSMGVYFEIETALPPCYTGEDQAILSHRWEMTHDHDANYYLTRIINGYVIFNRGVLESQSLQPDWFRNQFFHPIPLGFQRKLGPISVSPDGDTIRYTIIDTDTSVIFDPADSGATRMDIQEIVEYSNPFGQAWNLI